MDPEKRYCYHQVAKKLGVPNIILTGVENNAKREYPDDDERFVCHVIKTLETMADKYDGDWSKCESLFGVEVPVVRNFK